MELTTYDRKFTVVVLEGGDYVVTIREPGDYSTGSVITALVVELDAARRVVEAARKVVDGPLPAGLKGVRNALGEFDRITGYG